MLYVWAIVLGAVQGLTEFLPISSTGHLIIVEKIFGLSHENFGLAFDASVHLGTLFAIIVFFYKDYISLLNFKNPLLFKLIIGTLPAIIFGLIFENVIEGAIRQLWIVAVALLLFSIVMIFAEKHAKQNRKKESIKFLDALIIGIFQALALIPGISRSASTISAGLLLNLTKEESARFAFILSGPIVAGAGIKKFLEVASQAPLGVYDLKFFLVGIITSSVFGYLTIKYFIRYLATKTLYPFVVYRIFLGIALLLYVFFTWQ